MSICQVGGRLHDLNDRRVQDVCSERLAGEGDVLAHADAAPTGRATLDWSLKEMNVGQALPLVEGPRALGAQAPQRSTTTL